MYTIEIYNHEYKSTIGRLDFHTKKEARVFVVKHCEKRGRDYYSNTDRSLEYNFLF